MTKTADKPVAGSISIYSTFLLISIKLPAGVFIFTSHFPWTNRRQISPLWYLREPRARALRQPSRCPITKLTRQAVGCSCIVLSQGLDAGAAPPLCRLSVGMSLLFRQALGVRWTGSHTSTLEAIGPLKSKPGWLCALCAGINVCVCLGAGCLPVTEGLQPPLFILLPHSSHKVNCWDDLYLSKHLREITSLATPSV